MSIDWNGTECADGRASYYGQDLPNEVLSLRAEVRQQTARADGYRDRCEAAEGRLYAIVHRVRTLPRYTATAGERVVSAAALDKALGVTR